MKARMAPKRLSHSEAVQVTQAALEATAPAVVAAVIYILYQRGWHKDKLLTLYREVVNFFRYPQVFDKYLTDIEVREYLTEKINIDWNELINAVKVVR